VPVRGGGIGSDKAEGTVPKGNLVGKGKPRKNPLTGRSGDRESQGTVNAGEPADVMGKKSALQNTEDGENPPSELVSPVKREQTLKSNFRVKGKKNKIWGVKYRCNTIRRGFGLNVKDDKGKANIPTRTLQKIKRDWVKTKCNEGVRRGLWWDSEKSTLTGYGRTTGAGNAHNWKNRRGQSHIEGVRGR